METGMDFEMFYDLADYINKKNKVRYTEKGVAMVAFGYMEHYREDVRDNLIGDVMLKVLKSIYPEKDFNTDMDKFDMTWYLVGAWNDIRQK